MFEASIRFRVKSCSFLLYLWCAASSYSKGCFRVRLMGWLQLMTCRAAARGIVLLHNLLQRHRELWERDLMIVFSSIIPQSFMLAISSWFLRSQIASISASSSAQRCCQALHPSTGFCYWWNLVHSVKSWRCIVLLLLSYSSLASSAATNPRHPHRLHLHKDALSASRLQNSCSFPCMTKYGHINEQGDHHARTTMLPGFVECTVNLSARKPSCCFDGPAAWPSFYGIGWSISLSP